MLTAEQKANLETLDFSKLSPEELAEAMEIASGKSDDGRGASPEIIPEKPIEVVPEIIPEKPTETYSEKEAVARLKEENFRRASEANHWKQQAEKYKAQAEKPAVVETEIDVWDTETQKKTIKSVNAIESELESLRRERSHLEAERAKDNIFREADNLAKEFNLPLNSVREMDDKFQSLAVKLGRAPNQSEMNAEYQGDKGVDAYFDVLSAAQLKSQGGYPSMRAAFKDRDLDSKWKVQGSPDYFVAKSESEGHRQTTQSVAGRTKTLTSSYSGDAGELTESFAENWLSKNSDQRKWTAEDFKTFASIEKKFMS